MGVDHRMNATRRGVAMAEAIRDQLGVTAAGLESPPRDFETTASDVTPPHKKIRAQTYGQFEMRPQAHQNKIERNFTTNLEARPQAHRVFEHKLVSANMEQTLPARVGSSLGEDAS